MTESFPPFAIDTDTITGEMKPIRRAVISLGSNLGDRAANLQGAVSQLAATPDVWVTSVSPVYETVPLDCDDDASDYLNAIVLIDTTISPSVLLDRAMAIEEAFERQRTPGMINEPRTIDVDLIQVGNSTSATETLTLPHPRAGERGFVLAPWLDVEPDAELVGGGLVEALLIEVGTEGLVKTDIVLTLD